MLMLRGSEIWGPVAWVVVGRRDSYLLWTNGLEHILSSDQIRSVAQSCPTLCDPMDCSLPGFSIQGIFQARVLEFQL